MPFLALLLLLASFVSNAEEDGLVLKGDLRVYLPRSGNILFINTKLIEHQSAPKIISEQQCLLNDMAMCNFELLYQLKNINRSKQHTVDIDINYQISNKQQTYKTSFNVPSISNPEIMNIIIQIPSHPIP